MLLVTVTLHVHADKRDEAIAAAGVARAATLAEDGCIDYRFFTATDDPNAVLVLERWRDVAALETHMTTPHLATLQQAMGALVDGPLDMQRYEVPDPA
jgi:quinol monooxygenase YgiN